MRKKRKNWFCAFKSVNQMKKWFEDHELSILAKHNYKIMILKVKEFQEGNHQIAFTKESIKRRKDITHKFLN
jgi:hypothetical protein